MNDNFSIKFNANEGVRRYSEDEKKPTAGVNANVGGFKKILDKDDERKGSSRRVSDKKDASQGDDDNMAESVNEKKAPVGRQSQNNSGGEDDLFSLFSSKKGSTIPQPKTPTAKTDTAFVSKVDNNINAQPEVAEDWDLMRPQQIVEGEAVPPPKQPFGLEPKQQPNLGSKLPSKLQPKQELNEFQPIGFEEEEVEPQEDLSQSQDFIAEETPHVITPRAKPTEMVDQSRTAAPMISLGDQEEKSVEEKVPQQPLVNQQVFDTKEKRAEIAVGQQMVVPVLPKKEPDNIFGMAASRKSRNTEKESALSESSVSHFSKIDKPKESSSHLTSLPNVSSSEDITVDDEETSIVGKISSKKENVANPFPQEQVDLSAVNPQVNLQVNPQGMIAQVMPMEIKSNVGDVAKPIRVPIVMHVLVENLMKEMSVMQVGDKTESIITLGANAGIFAKAQVVITGYESAKGEFNITIANLTQNAQQVLQGAQADLLTALGTRGYFVHIFTATTAELQNPIATATHSDKEQEQRQGQPQGGRQQPKDQEGRSA